MPLYNPKERKISIDDVLNLDDLLDGYGGILGLLADKINNLKDGYIPINLVASTNAAEPLQKDIDSGKTITFPIYYQYEESEAESSTTSLTLKNKVTINTPVLPSGTFRIQFFYEWSDSSPSANFIGQVSVDNEVIAYTFAELADNSQYAYIDQSGFKYIELLAGSHTVKIDYCSSKSGKAAKIRRARLEFWRIR